MAAARKALAIRAEAEKAEKLAAKQAMKEEKLMMKASGGPAIVAPAMQDVGMEDAGTEAAFEVDHSNMKPLENMSALEMFMTTWNVWKSYVNAKKENPTKPAMNA